MRAQCKLNFTGLVLAGGQSSRMGQDKALLKCPSGETLTERASALLVRCGAKQVFISSHNQSLESALGDLFPNRGPVSGIHAALTHTQQRPLLVLPVDMPLMHEALLLELIQLGNSKATSCCFARQCLPLFIYQSESALAIATTMLSGADNVSVWRFIHAISAQELTTDACQAFKNANNPQQWQECRNLIVEHN